MKKYILLFKQKIIRLLFIIGTIISLFLAYENVDTAGSTAFVIGYAIFTIVFLF
jgi:hypothetical protein